MSVSQEAVAPERSPEEPQKTLLRGTKTLFTLPKLPLSNASFLYRCSSFVIHRVMIAISFGKYKHTTGA